MWLGALTGDRLAVRGASSGIGLGTKDPLSDILGDEHDRGASQQPRAFGKNKVS